jgi:5-methylcytosine-specific restriction endonuclease McrA
MFEKKILLLNANYEPLTICKLKKALKLLFLKKAELVESENGRKIRTPSTSLVMPSVIRLAYYVKVKRREIPLTKKNILRRDNYTCQYCGRKNVPLTTDHIIPKAYGGKDEWENLVCACVECNTLKGNKRLSETNLKLLKKPKAPTYITFLLNSLPEIPENWRPYLFQR